MSEALALMSRDDADEILVAQLGVLLIAAKHSDTVADEYILKAAIANKAARLWLLERLGFSGDEAMAQFGEADTMPLFENVGSILEIVNFLRVYGPQIKKIIETVMELLNGFKGLTPSGSPVVPSPPTIPTKPNF